MLTINTLEIQENGMTEWIEKGVSKDEQTKKMFLLIGALTLGPALVFLNVLNMLVLVK